MSMPNGKHGGQNSRKGVTVGALLGVVAAMSVLVGFSVPLYRLFCAATGYNGTTQRATAAAAEIVKDRTITVRFDAEMSRPACLGSSGRSSAQVQVHPGEDKIITYHAVNHRARSRSPARATFNVTPTKAGLYFDKLQCFCFTAQHLEPGQSADLAVSVLRRSGHRRRITTTTMSTRSRCPTPCSAPRTTDEPVQSSALPSNTNSIN